jgi:thioredoxin 1
MTRAHFWMGMLSLCLVGLPGFSQYSPAELPALDPLSLEQQLKGKAWLIVEFGGQTCIPCKRMQPTLLALQTRFQGKAFFRNFWIQTHPDTARRYRVMLMPTQVVFDPTGQEVLRHEGFWDQGEFLAALNAKGLR